MIPGPQTADICASFQEAVVDVLSSKAIRAAKKFAVKDVVVCGGVAANPRLRELLSERGKNNGIKVHGLKHYFIFIKNILSNKNGKVCGWIQFIIDY